MLESEHVVAFVPSQDLDRSEEFYVGALGLPLVERTPYALVLDLGGATLRVTQVGELRPQPFTVLGWEVEDARATVARLREHGVPTLRYDGMEQDDDGVWTTPTGDLVAWFHDPESNVLSVTELASG